MTTPTKSVVVAYIRCSGDGQVEGDSFPRQREKIDHYANANSITVEREFIDQGVTGKMELEGRAGLSECLQYARENHIEMVLVEDASRLARDLIVSEVIIRQFKALGARIIACSAGIDLTDGDDTNPTAKLIRQILAAVAEFDRCCIVLKTRAARDRVRKEKGRCEGRQPFGARVGERETLDLLRQLDSEGLGPVKIAALLNEKGQKTRMGRNWHGGTVANILKRSSVS